MRSRRSVLLLAACLLLALSLGAPAGCKRGSQPFKAAQRTTATIPEVPNVQIEIGDVHLGRVDLRLVTRDGEELAKLPAAATGASIPFGYRGKRYALDVVSVEDHTLHDDWVHFRCHLLE